jgi:hypothetical protein
MSAGFPRTFEIGRAYRNEGSSPDHLQEFTNCEFYTAYSDYEDGMRLVQELYRTIAREVFGTTTFTTRGHTFNLEDEWKHITYREEILNQTGIDIESASDEEIVGKLQSLNVKYDGTNRERLTDTLWKYCRKHIAGPAFLINHPALVAPLAKHNSDGKTTQVFQPILAGSELGKGYSELAMKKVKQPQPIQSIKDYLPTLKKQMIMTILFPAILLGLLVGSILIITGTLAYTHPLVWILGVGTAALSAGSSLLIFIYTSSPLQDIMKALAHISGEPVTGVIPNPTQEKYKKSS